MAEFFFSTLREEAAPLEASPLAAPLVRRSILSQPSLAAAVAAVLTSKMAVAMEMIRDEVTPVLAVPSGGAAPATSAASPLLSKLVELSTRYLTTLLL